MISFSRVGEVNENSRPTILKVSVARKFLPYLINVGTPNLRRFIVRIFPWKALKEICGIVDIMDEASMKVFEEKKRALSEGDDAVLHQVGEGKDIMSILRAFMNVSFVVIASLITESSIAIVRANMDASAEDRLPDSELVAQMRWEWLHLLICLTLLQYPSFYRNAYDFRCPVPHPFDSCSSPRCTRQTARGNPTSNG